MSELVTVWSGAGWVGHDFGKGSLLPPYDSASTLHEAALRKAQPESRPRTPGMPRPRGHGGGNAPKVPPPLRDAIRAMKADGFTLRQIAERFERPLSTIWNIVMEKQA